MCYKCGSLEHISSGCSSVERCLKCLGSGHSHSRNNPCQNEPCCFHCGSHEHTGFSFRCKQLTEKVAKNKKWLVQRLYLWIWMVLVINNMYCSLCCAIWIFCVCKSITFWTTLLVFFRACRSSLSVLYLQLHLQVDAHQEAFAFLFERIFQFQCLPLIVILLLFESQGLLFFRAIYQQIIILLIRILISILHV